MLKSNSKFRQLPRPPSHLMEEEGSAAVQVTAPSFQATAGTGFVSELQSKQIKNEAKPILSPRDCKILNCAVDNSGSLFGDS
eukprot:s2271_g2.t1